MESFVGLLPNHISAPYQVSKHAAVAFSEKLYYDLAKRGGRVGVSALCPGWVSTNICSAFPMVRLISGK